MEGGRKQQRQMQRLSNHLDGLLLGERSMGRSEPNKRGGGNGNTTMKSRNKHKKKNNITIAV